MARADLVTATAADFKQTVVPTAAVADGDIIDVGNVKLYVENNSGAPITVTVQTTAVSQGLDVEDLVVPVAAGQIALIGPFPPSLFKQPSDAAVGASRALIDYSDVTSVVRAAVAA